MRSGDKRSFELMRLVPSLAVHLCRHFLEYLEV